MRMKFLAKCFAYSKDSVTGSMLNVLICRKRKLKEKKKITVVHDVMGRLYSPQNPKMFWTASDYLTIEPGSPWGHHCLTKIQDPAPNCHCFEVTIELRAQFISSPERPWAVMAL